MTSYSVHFFVARSEFPLQDITVKQYSIGSFGGVLFTWLGMITFYFLQRNFIKNRKKTRIIISGIYFGQLMVGLILLLFFILDGFSPIQENTFAENFFSLPQNSLFIFTILLTIILVILFLRQLHLKIRMKELLLFGGYLFAIVIFVVIIGVIVEQIFRKGHPTIKIGDVKLYNEPLPQRNNYDESK